MSARNKKLQQQAEALLKKPFRWMSLPTDIRYVALFSFRFLILHKLKFFALLSAAVVIALYVIRPIEGTFNHWLQSQFDAPFLHDAAAWLSWSGEYFFPLMILLPCWLIACLRRSRRLQVLTACILISFVASSLVVRVGKLGFGRLRPIVAERTEQPDTFIGPTLRPKYHSFPSGHTAAAFATSTPVFFIHPGIGSALSVCSGLIAFSRTYENQHYPSDLFGGLVVGILCALPGRTLMRAFPLAQAPNTHIANHGEPQSKKEKAAPE